MLGAGVVVGLEDFGKGQGVVVAHPKAHLLHRQIRLQQQGSGLLHPALHQVLLGRNPHFFLENIGEIAAVDADVSGHVADLRGGEVFPDVGGGVFHVDVGGVFRFLARNLLAVIVGLNGQGEEFHQQPQPQQVAGPVQIGLVQHPLHQIVEAVLLDAAGQPVDPGNEARAFRVALGVVSAIGHPAIAPGVLLIRLIPDILLGLGDEHLAEMQGRRPAAHAQLSLAGEDHMQMVAGPVVRVEGVARQTLLHPAENQKQIVALLLWEFQAAVFAGFIEHSLLFHASSFPAQRAGPRLMPFF